jgi:hypothetical protein
MRIRIQFFFISRTIQIRIRIQGANPIRIHTDPDPDSGQTLKSQKVEFSMNNTLQKGKSSTNTHLKAQKPFRKAGNQVIC